MKSRKGRKVSIENMPPRGERFSLSMIPSRIFDDKKLSYDNIGILCLVIYLIKTCKLDSVNVSDIAALGTDTPEQIEKSLNELEDAGYIYCGNNGVEPYACLMSKAVA